MIKSFKSPCSTMFVMFGVETMKQTPPWLTWNPPKKTIEAVCASTGGGEAKLQTSLELHHLGILVNETCPMMVLRI